MFLALKGRVCDLLPVSRNGKSAVFGAMHIHPVSWKRFHSRGSAYQRARFVKRQYDYRFHFRLNF